MAEDEKRQQGRLLVARVIADPAASGIAEGEDDGVFRLDPANPDHQAAVDDYFETTVMPGYFKNVALPGAVDRVNRIAAFIAATAIMPEGAETLLTVGLSIPPDLSSEPKTGPGPAEQAAAAALVARLEEVAPQTLAGIDPRIRARADLINKLIDSGTAPEEAPPRAEGLMAQLATGVERLKGGAGDDDLTGTGGSDFDSQAGIAAAVGDETDGGFTLVGEGNPSATEEEFEEAARRKTLSTPDGTPMVTIFLPEPTEHPDETSRIEDAEVEKIAKRLNQAMAGKDKATEQAIRKEIKALSPRDQDRVEKDRLFEESVDLFGIPSELVPEDLERNEAVDLVKRIREAGKLRFHMDEFRGKKKNDPNVKKKQDEIRDLNKKLSQFAERHPELGKKLKEELFNARFARPLAPWAYTNDELVTGLREAKINKEVFGNAATVAKILGEAAGRSGVAPIAPLLGAGEVAAEVQKLSAERLETIFQKELNRRGLDKKAGG